MWHRLSKNLFAYPIREWAQPSQPTEDLVKTIARALKKKRRKKNTSFLRQVLKTSAVVCPLTRTVVNKAYQKSDQLEISKKNWQVTMQP
jgi:hypothetical protein